MNALPLAWTLQSIAHLPLWVVWRNELRNGKKTKVPYSPKGGMAKADDPSTWATRAEAEAAAARMLNGSGGGLGLEFADIGGGLHLGGIDLDTCRDPATGAIEPWAQEVIARFGSYAEVSPSQTGAKLFFAYRLADRDQLREAMGSQHGKLWQRGGTEHPPAIELHIGNRYFAVTGEQLADAPATIETIPAETLLWLIRKIGPAFKGVVEKPQKKPLQAGPAGDDILVRLHRVAASSPRIQAILDKMDRYGSRSEKAMALGGALKAAGWPQDDMAAVLHRHPATADWAVDGSEADRRRQIDRIWNRAAEPGDDAPEWGDLIPLPNGLPPVAPFTENLLPEEFRPWVIDIANRMQCPPDFPAVAALVCAAAVIGRQIGIRPKRRDDWLVVPNLWGAVVGRPSLMKTPALAESRTILARLEAEARKKFEAETAEHELTGSIGKLIAKERTKEAAKSIKAAIENGKDPAEAARAAMQADDNDATKPVRRRYVTQDPTVEKLGELLIETPRGILVFRDELIGLLRSMDKDGHENDRGFYLEAWNGTGAYTYDRIGRGTVEIDAACVSILGGIQPGPLRAYISQANMGGAGDDGLLQRMQMLVWPDRGEQWMNVDEWPDTEAKNRVYAIFERLDRTTPRTEGADIPALRFDDAAQAAFNTWREGFERRFLAEDMPPALEAHLTKYRSLLPSLALIFHLIDTPDMGAVDVQHVRRAEAWLAYLESHARRLYAQILDPGLVAAIALSSRMDDLPDPFTTRDIYRRHWTGLDRQATEKALDVLHDLGHIRARIVQTDGRPTATYSKNPALNSHHTPKPEGAKSNKSLVSWGFGTFGTSTNRDMPENFPDEVEI